MTQTLTPGTTPSNGLTVNSDFGYTPPDSTPNFDLKAAEKNFIDQLLAGKTPTREPERAPGNELEQELSAETPEFEQEAQDFSAEAEPTAEQEQEPTDPEPESDPDDGDPKFARGIQRVVQRELAAKAREEAAAAREAAAEAKLAELRSLQGLKSTKELMEMAELDPIGMMKAMGKDPDTIIKLALAQQLGDGAPQALKDFARGYETKRETAAVRAELAAMKQAQAQQEYFNTISLGAREYVKKVGDSKTLPTLARAATVDSQYVHDEIMEEIVKDARVRGAQDPDGDPITYEEAAKRVEQRLSRIAKLTGSPGVQNRTNAAAKNAMKPNVTPPSTKSPAKPLAPWQNKSSNVEEDGLREAMLVYERMEAEKKARRS